MRSHLMKHLFAFFAIMANVSFGNSTDGDCDDTVDFICSDDRLSTLCSSIHIAGIVDDLSSYGGEKLTVFAPINQAFDELGGTFDEILADPYKLVDLLLFHAATDDGAKARSSEDLECTGLIKMANGQDSRTVCTGHQNGNNNNFKYHQKGINNPRNAMPEIIDFDIPTCNGYIQVIDKVMRPESLPTVVVTPSRPNVYDSSINHRRRETKNHLRR